MIDLDALHARLVRIDGLGDLTRAALRPMAVKGIAHDHIRIAGRDLVVRAPRTSQWHMAPAANLDYQAACFRRAEPAGHTPALFAAIAPDDALPYGALVVAEIRGRVPRVPDDYDAIAAALAAVHALPLPAEDERPPLVYHRDPVAGTLARIEEQAPALDRLELDEASRRALADELAWARRFAVQARGLEQPVTLALTDTHPGNFLIDADGRAVFLDLEKALYGSPAIDLAHASLYTSTMWDPDCARALGILDVARLYRAYLEAIDRGMAEALKPWFTPMRRLTWLRTTTWAARWLVEERPDARLPEALMKWIEARFVDYFEPATIARIRDEWRGEEPLDLFL